MLANWNRIKGGRIDFFYASEKWLVPVATKIASFSGPPRQFLLQHGMWIFHNYCASAWQIDGTSGFVAKKCRCESTRSAGVLASPKVFITAPLRLRSCRV